MNKNRPQGDTAEAVAALYYMNLGYVVSKPQNHSPYYDLLVDTGECILRVECKSSRYARRGGFEVQVCTSGGNRSWNGLVKTISASKTDVVFILTADGNYYEFPPHKLDGSTKILVKPELPEHRGRLMGLFNALRVET